MSILVPFKTATVSQEGGLTTTGVWDSGNKSANITLSGGDLTASMSSTSGDNNAFGDITNTTGKFYWEITANSFDSGDTVLVGLAQTGISTSTNLKGSAGAWLYGNDGYERNASTGDNLGAWSANDIIMIAIDIAAGRIWFGKNGTWAQVGDPANGLNAQFNNVSGTVYPCVAHSSGGSKSWNVTANFGSTAMTYTVPAGFYSGYGTP
jgi:hypothetical protein